MKLHIVPQIVIMLAALLQANAALADEEDGSTGCGRLRSAGQYGPYDYRTATKAQVEVVLFNHFTSDVENLRRGVTTGKHPAGDMDYTLRALPNYARALVAMMRIAERENTDQPAGAQYTVACYFERALRFRPDDHIVRMLYASYLMKKNHPEDAIPQLDYVASTADPENALTHYNLSLLYLDAAQYDKAKEQALQAETLGKPIDAIRARLSTAGHPLAEVPAASAAASAAELPASAASR